MAPPSGEVAPVRGETMFGKRGGIKVLDAKTKRPAVEGRRKDQEGGAKPPERRGPGVRFAAMPEVKQPTTTTKSAEEKVQKPILKLPSDVLKGKSGTGRVAPLQALAEKVDRERKQKDTDMKSGVLAEGRAGGPLSGKGKKNSPHRIVVLAGVFPFSRGCGAASGVDWVWKAAVSCAFWTCWPGCLASSRPTSNQNRA